jgi:hypothetical protein
MCFDHYKGKPVRLKVNIRLKIPYTIESQRQREEQP